MLTRSLVLKSGFGLSFALCSLGVFAQDFPLTILHTNDLHAHVESSRVSGVNVGGYARQATAILKLRQAAEHSVLLNGGDTFQGTLYFNIYEGLADLSFMNLIGYDAMCLGNHEFDRGPKVLSNFVRLAKFPVLSTNLDFSKDPDLEPLVKKYTILDVDGQKIGVVGATTPDLPNISSPGPTVKMTDYVSSIQKSVDELTQSGVNKIILLTHSGYELDQEAATKLRGVDVVVGGHSHTLLGNVAIPNFNGARGAYPTIVKDKGGQNVLIVQAWEWGKAIGRLRVVFDEKGAVKSYEGAPVLVDESFPEDPYVKGMMEAFRKPIESMQTTKIAESGSEMSRNWSVSGGDSGMGNVISDAVLDATKAQGAQVAFWNQGGVRSSLEKGVVTYGKLIEVCPFGNQLVVIDLTGEEILAALEHGATGAGLLIPSRGFTYTIDPNAPDGKKVSAVSLNGAALDLKKVYKVTVNNFVAGGGDSHTVIKEAKGKRIETGYVDIDALVEYFKAHSPVTMTDLDRIKVKK